MSLIRDAARIEERQKALENYIDYIQTLDNRETFRTTGQGTYQPRGTLQRIALTPFGFDLPAATFALAYLSDKAKTKLATPLGARIKVDPASLSGSLKLDDFIPAKVVLFEGSTNVITKRSKFTKLYYRKHQGDTYTSSFGASSDGEEFADGAAAAKAAVLAAATSPYKKVYVKPERILV